MPVAINVSFECAVITWIKWSKASHGTEGLPLSRLVVFWSAPITPKLRLCTLDIRFCASLLPGPAVKLSGLKPGPKQRRRPRLRSEGFGRSFNVSGTIPELSLGTVYCRRDARHFKSYLYIIATILAIIDSTYYVSGMLAYKEGSKKRPHRYFVGLVAEAIREP